MSRTPWLTIIGIGEDGPDGLSPASLSALSSAEIVMGSKRHLRLIPETTGALREWPVPFADGVADLMQLRGQKVAVLASGDPFWFGAGTVLSQKLDPDEWVAHPNLSCFALAASKLGWALERTRCLGLHAAPMSRLAPHLSPGTRIIATVRDGASVEALLTYLRDAGFGQSDVWVMEALGGPRETVTRVSPTSAETREFTHPVVVAIETAGLGKPVPMATGRPDDLFDHDGQITKQPVRAITLSALAPRFGERLWDIGAGSGSIGIEWMLCDPSLRAIAIERDETRATRIRANATELGVDGLDVVQASAVEAIKNLPRPDAVFVGGGLSQDLLDQLFETCPGSRLVINAVTLESEALVVAAQAKHGGDLLRIELSSTQPLGPKRGWKSAYPIVQWSVTI